MFSLSYLLLVSKMNVSMILISVLVSVCMGVVNCNPGNFELGGMVWVDFLSAAMIFLTLYISMLMFMESCSSERRQQMKTAMVVLCSVLISAFGLTNLFFFFFFFESVLIPVLFLILVWGYQPERLQAGTYMVLYTSLGSFPFLFAISMMVSSGLSDMMQSLTMIFNRSVCWFYWFYMLGFLIKLPMFPFHLWLPKAHVEAPVVGSMILAGILLKLGGYGMIRYLMLIIISPTTFVYSLLLSVALVGGLLTSMMCLRQVDLKSLVAYSSVGHMSLVILGVLSNKMVGYLGSLLMMLGHGLCSSGLFLLVNLFYKQSTSRSIMFNKGGLAIFPSLALFCFLLSSGNMAAPPTLNFVGEVFLFMTSSSVSGWFVLAVGLMSFMSACYCLFFYGVCCHGKNNEVRECFVSVSNLLNLFLHWFPLNLLFVFL
nr:NADH dehydrogenase subunit 4 [Brachidontes pharaonis]